MNKTIISTIASLFAIVSVIVGTILWMDTKYASCAKIDSIEKRLDYKIESDKLIGMQQRAWQLQDRYSDINKAPIEVKQQMRELDSDLNMQREKVKKLESK